MRTRKGLSLIVALALAMSSVVFMAASAVAGSSGAYTQSSGQVTKTNLNLSASGIDESGVIVSGGIFTLNHSTITKTGDSTNLSDSSFYGLNAGVLAETGGVIRMDNCTVDTQASGANGAYATDAGSVISMNNCRITTDGNGAHGVDATVTGTVYAEDLHVTSGGAHAAGLATDTGRGTVEVSHATVNTSGAFSPGIYCTGVINANNSTITATDAEGAVVLGDSQLVNSVALTNTDLTGAVDWGVWVRGGNGTFTMKGGSLTLTAADCPLFNVTASNAVIKLKDVQLAPQTSDTLLDLAQSPAPPPGTPGSGGGAPPPGGGGAPSAGKTVHVAFTADHEVLPGDIVCANTGSVTAGLQNHTVLTGSVDATDYAGATVALTLDKTSVWNVTGTSYLAGLTDADGTLANIHSNGYTVYYDSSANSWLGGKTYTLTGGGQLVPM